MKKFLFLFICTLFISACGAVKVPITNTYQLTQTCSHFNPKQLPTDKSILITAPEAFAGYQSEKMLYVNKYFALNSFANNAWVDNPANMLHPLLVESIQKSNRFKVVASNFFAEPVDYRLDTQLIKLHQNFTTKPSTVELSVKFVLINVRANTVLRSRIFNFKVPSSEDTPYGGVVAANKATQLLTKAVTQFVI